MNRHTAITRPAKTALTVWCQFCGAKKGRPCIPIGLPCAPRKKPHAARVRAAKEKK